MQLDKAKARKHALKVIDLIPESERSLQRKTVVYQLTNHPWVEQAKVIGGYFPLKNEISLISFFNTCLLAKKTLLMPKIINDTLNYYLVHSVDDFTFFDVKSWNHSHKFLLWNQLIDLLIIPCIAFNKQNYRIGSGKGNFDRYLQRTTVKTIGVSWKNCCINFETEDHDIALNIIIN